MFSLVVCGEGRYRQEQGTVYIPKPENKFLEWISSMCVPWTELCSSDFAVVTIATEYSQ